jgi:hypothetical protein
MSAKTARAASRPVRAIPFPPGTKPWCRTDTATVQLSGCRLVRAVPHPKAAKKQADETLCDELTRYRGHPRLSNPRIDSLAIGRQITGGKRTCQCALRHLRMACCEFGPSSCSRLVQCLSGCWAQTIRRLPRGSRGRGESWTRPASDRSRDIGAKWRFLEGGVPSHALFQVDNVPMANLLRGDRHSGGAEVLP